VPICWLFVAILPWVGGSQALFFGAFRSVRRQCASAKTDLFKRGIWSGGVTCEMNRPSSRLKQGCTTRLRPRGALRWCVQLSDLLNAFHCSTVPPNCLNCPTRLSRRLSLSNRPSVSSRSPVRPFFAHDQHRCLGSCAEMSPEVILTLAWY
jgi:hypothetical protein